MNKLTDIAVVKRMIDVLRCGDKVVVLDFDTLADCLDELLSIRGQLRWRKCPELPDFEYKTVRVKTDAYGERIYGVAYYSKPHEKEIWNVCWDANTVWEALDVEFDWLPIPPLNEEGG